MKYKCGCTASGDNIATYCPIHGEAEDRSSVLFMTEIEQAIQYKNLVNFSPWLYRQVHNLHLHNVQNNEDVLFRLK